MIAQQPELFARDPASVPGLYVEVAVPLPVRGTFSYAVPRGMVRHVEPGVRVAVPFGKQRVAAFVVGSSESAPPSVDPSRIRPVFSVLDAQPVFPPDLLRFLREAADYYLHPFGEVLRAAAPAVETRARPAMPGEPEHGKRDSLRAKWARVREETFVRLLPDARKAMGKPRGDRQAEVLAMLESRGEMALAELRAQVKSARAVVEGLAERGVVHVERREVPADPFFGDAVPRDAPPLLTTMQARAVESISGAIQRGERATFLLHGVTGSGKTEVYLRAVDVARKQGKGALILLPEIALTPQLVGRYRARFGDNLAVMHSGMRDNDRHAMWKKLRSGECQVAIGARSAVFAPVEQLGLVIVDEEHDGSFKQEDNFRYHGRDLALLRAHRLGVTCVLGSATPSVESYHAALDGRYQLLMLPDRATSARLPEIELVNLKHVSASGPAAQEQLSLPLKRAIAETIGRGEQVILFLNRRGFAPSVRCVKCDGALQCPSCSVGLVLHRRAGALKCHYCDFTVPFTNTCVNCGGTELTLLGVGTERVEQALVSAFPVARVGRLDRDVASGAGAEVVLEKLRRGDLDILVGTQMVTKGHDFPRVTLVGVIAADSALSLPDFRACERTFQLLSQVAGRAGRADLPGKVLIQTWQPEHPVLRRTQAHDYHGFFADEVAARKELGYPPFGRVAALRFDALDEAQVRTEAERVSEFLRGLPEVADGTVKVLGPAPSPIERIRARYRMQCLLRASERPPLRRVLVRLANHLEREPSAHVRVAIDVDPVQML